MVDGDETSPVGDGDQGADVVKEVDEEEDEDDLEGVEMESSSDVEMKGRCADCQGVEGGGLVFDLVEEDAEEEGAEDSDEHGGFDFVGLQDGDEQDAEEGELGGVVVEVAEGDGGGVAADDDAGVDQADEGDEEADASGDGGVELVRDGADQALADASDGEQEEEDAGEEDGAEGGLPGDVHALDDGVGEVGVEAHAGGEG